MAERKGAPETALNPAAWQYLDAHRLAHLATVGNAGRPLVVPLCYATDGQAIYSALDAKPKRVRPEELTRVRHIRANPQVALLVDDYCEDWTRLAYLLVLMPGGAEHAKAVARLRAKYVQYEQMAIKEMPVIRIVPTRSTFWSSGSSSGSAQRSTAPG